MARQLSMICTGMATKD